MSFKDLVLEYKEKSDPTRSIFKETDEYFLKNNFKNNQSFLTQPINPISGEIYYFNYSTDSKISKERKFIDRFPVVLCTDFFLKDSVSIIKGIDLVTVPPKYRMEILSRIYDNFAKDIENNSTSTAKTPLNLKDDILDKLLVNTGYKYSVFGFKSNFIKNIGIIKPKDWSKLPYLTINVLEGLRIQGIYNEYESKLK